MSLDDIHGMSQEAFEMFWQAITVIEAQETLMKFTVADMPHLKSERRTKIHREVYKKAHPKIEAEKSNLTIADIASALMGPKNG